ncbi:trihelix transcription factor GTL1 isoform X1 [Ziziphus jujuba]|uniref:Trihelix transcription factor GTL1 isoform X1 n=1 Tax=Ziziphus jujuba TaxID=326968 RepID=A0ABM4ABX6_ZIZJJ|nr:trihelix transcription factor GTL1 isoform X1 [Ziziphus jujuba]
MQEGEAVGGEQGQQLIEEASPISSRPPASASVNLDEFMGLSDGGGGGAGGGGGGGSSGNRWPRQETLALLKIRSDMDASFRDATLKGPLWEDVSRKLAELGYKRSAKKCKEKFENVHKYYKRTKEGRAGRQDGKSYKFFTQLEALHSATTQTANQFVAAVNPMPISSFRVSPSLSTTPSKLPSASTSMPMIPPLDMTKPATHANMTASTAGIFPTGVTSFSSNSSSSSPSSQDDDDNEDDDLEGEPSNISRKRKRESWKESSHRMMEFFENLMKQVMQKQEAMQQKFLEIIEKREEDRMIREEAWKRQEMTRLSREHELMAQERAISASRDAAIISFLQKITGQIIQLPPPVGNNIHHPAPPASAPPPPPPAVPSLTQQQQQQDKQKHKDQSQCTQQQQQQPSAYTDQIAVAVNAEQHATPQLEFTGGSRINTTTTTLEATSSSRWPKAEVVALINLRGGLESRYQEVGPKGPLWEEISSGMQRMGYKRSAKRCKEKWENINKYFKKIKESNKKRPDDSKTCPYFHQLDALHLKKVNIIGSSSAHAGEQRSISAAKQSQDKGDAETSMAAPNQQPELVRESENKTAATTDRVEITSSLGLPSSFFGEGTVVQGASEKPEDIVKELVEQQENHRQQPPVKQQLIVDDYDQIEEPDSEDIEQEDEDEDEDDNEELEDHGKKMAYKIELIQRQKATGTSATGGGNGAPSFLAMVQ